MKFMEKKLVENYILQKLCEKGWTNIPADELERESYEEPLLIPNLVRALERINKDKGISDEEVNKVINELKLTPTGIEGSKRILNFYKFGVPVKFEKEKVVNYVQLFDFEKFRNNEFIATRQVYLQGKDRIRIDILLYINGIPLVNIECKSPANVSESWLNAYSQIKDYENIVPELYKYTQIGVAAESEARYFPIVPWQGEVKIHEWREEGKDSIGSLTDLLSRETLLDIIRNFLFFRVEMGSATKVITRYMQFRAANRMINRIIGSLRGKEKKNKGLVWHWQGSGKTLTMIFAANKLYYGHELENPTIFFIVDRIELQDQLYGEFHSLDLVKPEIIGSISELRRLLRYDDYRSKRGIFIILIHKFRPEELREVQKELEEVSSKKETIMNRRNIVAFIDEGHRTQYGLLAAQMKAILKGAFFFALTGTPISKRGRDTYLEFSYPSEEPYLDKYFITDSIKDGFTVKIVYQPRLEKDVHLKKDLLEAFLEAEFEELPEEIREGVEEGVKRRLNDIKLFHENPERIRVIARDIAQHFKENIDGKFKAMIASGSRKACVYYKNELDKHLPHNYSEVVITYTQEDQRKRREIHRYVAEARAKYGGRNYDEIKKDYIEKFKEEELPKILIVTDMLLTGFDVPLLQILYLDKPLKEHRLLQAVARTNRPYKNLKEAGIIIDYVGVLKEFKRALEMYSEEDINDALNSYEDIKEDFVARIKEILEIFSGLPRDYERQSLLRAIEILTSEEGNEDEFIKKYKTLRKIFELLGPWELKLEYIEDFKWLSAVYTYYRKTVIQRSDEEAYIQKYYEKTLNFVHKSTEIERLEKELPVVAFDEHYLQTLEEKVKDKKEKAANILFTLNRLVLVERHRNPVYESLVDKVERLLEMWKERTRDYGRIYSEGMETFSKMNTLFARQKSLDLSDFEYSMLLELDKKLDKKEDFVALIKDFSEELRKHMFKGWIHQLTVKKEVERDIRKFVRCLKAKYNLSFDEMNNLHEKIMESVKNFGD